jgi:ABC-type Fe3+ transport system permease subunit
MTTTVLMPSDRKFGWTFTAVFVLLGAFAYSPLLVGIGAILALITLTRAHWLAPAKRAWMKFGELLHHVISPVVMGLIYFAVFTPSAIVMRLAGRDALDRSYDAAAPTYWKRRDPPGPADDSFTNLY